VEGVWGVLMCMSIYDSAIYVNNFYALHKYAFGFYDQPHVAKRSEKSQDEAVKSISGREKMTFPKTLLSNQMRVLAKRGSRGACNEHIVDLMLCHPLNPPI